MTIEERIFKRTIIDFSRLEKFGFIKSAGKWTYSELFMSGDFKAVVNITPKGNISGTVLETATEDEFLPLRVENMEGFAGEVRAEYQKILEKIKENCCRINYFVRPQANRLTQAIFDAYGDEPVFPWDNDDSGVFKNPNNGKWYALIMCIDRSKLDKKLSGAVEVVNIKLDEAKIPELHKQAGFYPAYHMNKKNWLTITLDDTVSDEILLELVNESHTFTLGKHKRRLNGNNAWLVPANPKFFDIEAAFAKQKEIIWKQSSDLQVGDTAYMYVGTPISAVLYKCAVTAVDIPYEYEDENLKISKVMKIKLLKKYAKDFMDFAKLGEYGVRTVRGPRICPPNLVAVLK